MSDACLVQGHSGVEGPCGYCGRTPPVRVGPWCDPMETLADLIGPEPDDTDCVDALGEVWPEHDFGPVDCRRCGAEPDDTD